MIRIQQSNLFVTHIHGDDGIYCYDQNPNQQLKQSIGTIYQPVMKTQDMRTKQR